ncbi:hypothetical protein EVAR_86428_1 [Eumeta japonica]|uniref:Uncharacterized protein n=1 Tax=Eumeta variegata TaxID=151549 RepID=A0A4C1ZAQ5_EUMVA|nr:hypothetical protein EVAR_86428_1 [Eumeta japonica]
MRVMKLLRRVPDSVRPRLCGCFNSGGCEILISSRRAPCTPYLRVLHILTECGREIAASGVVFRPVSEFRWPTLTSHPYPSSIIYPILCHRLKTQWRLFEGWRRAHGAAFTHSDHTFTFRHFLKIRTGAGLRANTRGKCAVNNKEVLAAHLRFANAPQTKVSCPTLCTVNATFESALRSWY